MMPVRADSLLGRMFEMVERQLRLAHGPAFEDSMVKDTLYIATVTKRTR